MWRTSPFGACGGGWTFTKVRRAFIPSSTTSGHISRLATGLYNWVAGLLFQNM